MRYVLFLMLLLQASTLHADEIKCYNHGSVIYSAQGQDFTYIDGIFTFIEAKTNKVVFVSADCVVKVTV